MSLPFTSRRPLLRWGHTLREALRRLVGSPLLSHSALAVFDQAVVSGTSFATSVLLARYSTRQEVGTYYLALSVLMLARGIQEQVICAPYMIYCHKKAPPEAGRYAASVLLHHAALSGLFCLLLVLAAGSGLGPDEARGVWWVVGVGGPLILLRECVRQMVLAHLKVAQALLLDGCVCGLQLGLLGVTATLGQLTVNVALGILALAAGTPAIGWLLLAARRLKPSLRAAADDLALNWRFGRWALASHLLASLTPYVMPWAVAWSRGTAETGLWGAANTLVGLSNIFLMGLCNSLSPRAAQAYAAEGVDALKQVLLRTAMLFGATLGTLCLAAWMCGEWVAVTLLGPSFAGIGPLVGLLSVSVLVNSVGVVAGNGLWAMDRPRASFLADAAALGVVVATTLWWVPWGGALGAAAATLAGTSVDALVRLAILRSVLKQGAEEAVSCAP
jgi:O-antigen/teichoic acid export membrane protein